MFSILERYIGKMIFNFIIMTLFVLLSLSSIIKFVEQLRKIGQGSYSVVGALFFTGFSVVQDIELFFPLAALLGSLLGLGSLVICNELLVIQAFGFSRTQIIYAVMKTAIPLVLLAMAIAEWVAPETQKLGYDYRTQMISEGSVFAHLKSVWVKDGDDFICIERIVKSDELVGVHIYHFDKTRRIQLLQHADHAKFSQGSWKLRKVNEADLTNDKEITRRKMLNFEWKTSLTPKKLQVACITPNSLSISGLFSYINHLKQTGQESKHYQLIMWKKIFLPLSLMVMMLMALSFVFGLQRTASIRVKIVLGISCGFLFYILERIFGFLSLVCEISPIYGALLPIIGFLLISVCILLRHNK
ncbi:putative permease [secondary endosymbiont of Heteropsylla cubana]|uniref:Putative permease n=1 Tax=secondary endosymbiont of Heteropsylla cubana TaxID=134287 RepID=J3VTY9_9ENTR|nr:LPS export ABC transporter permease LptG [secondary endosymbiont of Heteropsylla cubana]AFP85526.1 putative permease [secondary endosymbiont of Heteropsylla cubana]